MKTFVLCQFLVINSSWMSKKIKSPWVHFPQLSRALVLSINTMASHSWYYVVFRVSKRSMEAPLPIQASILPHTNCASTGKEFVVPNRLNQESIFHLYLP
jgi:hypothetical protein